ncbi:MAG TPA: hypothetical protein VLI92_05090 [Candidatus Saccharimonadales bacterium]|nr:hypothetical protein [Candidatus Saccharimonadales bacterium]
MSSPYQFSPITNEEQFDQVLSYLTLELEKLSQKLFNQKLPITTLKVFPHYFEEYDYLKSLITKMGPAASFNAKTSFYIKTSKKIRDYHIEYIGVRIVDPYRLQVGCGDYEPGNYKEFKTKHLNTSPYIREVPNDMLEVWHPDFNVLGYVVPPL